MKNIYALNTNSEIINVKEVVKLEKYYCINCSNELVPKLGKIRQHHFAHKHTSCNFETYLHKLGKISFYNSYVKALKNKTPFYAEYYSKSTCTSCKESVIGIECEFNIQVKKFDLTKYFDIIEIEKGIKGFIVDVLLSSSKKREDILIEIAVSHFCEKEKINSGLKIIEFQMKNETDLKLFNNNIIKLNNQQIKFHNFKQEVINQDIYEPNYCSKKIRVFKVLKNGKAIITNQSISKTITESNSKGYLNFQILKQNEPNEFNDFGSKFIDLVKNACLNGIGVKNCYACRFSTKNEHKYANTSLMCRKLYKEIENSNEAIDCSNFWKIKNKIPYPVKYKKFNSNDWR